MTSSVLMSEMTWVEFEERVSQDQAIVILPVGALEQHGPHLPLATDTLIPMGITTRVAERIGAIVAPPMSYGYKSQTKSGGGQHFPGTTSLDGHSLTSVLRDVIREFARHGVRKLVLFDGHMENLWFIVEGIDLALRELRYANIDDMRIVKLDYWEFLTERITEKLFEGSFISWEVEHAAVMETSVMMYLHPDLVHLDQIPDHPPAVFPGYDMYPSDTSLVPSSGALSSAKLASAEKGEMVVTEFVDRISEALREAFGGH